jgi:hypothetical protein
MFYSSISKSDLVDQPPVFQRRRCNDKLPWIHLD